MAVATKKQPRPELKKPENFDLKKAQDAAEKVIRENIDWLKEMANR